MPPEAAPALIRPARPDDAAALARIHVTAWQATYRGAMPDAYLDGLDVTHWTRDWSRALSEGERPNLQVAELAGAVVGFVNGGRDRAAGGDGEVYALNVAPGTWRRGVGSALLGAAERLLRTQGHDQAVLWVVPSNDRARRFYERLGWHDDHAARRAVVRGVEIDEIRYAKDLGAGSSPEGARVPSGTP